MNQEQNNIMILLELEKNMVKNYSTAITEASSNSLTEEIIKLFNDSNNAQRKIFNLASSKGWYSLEAAPQDKIVQEQQKLSQKLTNI